MDNSLENKITRIEDTVKVMKTNLRLDENEVIEKVAEGTNLKTLSNIFVQDTEPEIKDGIWIKTDANTHGFDNIIIDDNAVIPGKWRCDKEVMVNSGLSSSFYMTPGRPHHIIYLNGNMYLSNSASGKYLIQYNLATKTLNKLTPTEYAFRDMATNGVDKIYLVANQCVETYDLNTNTFTKKKYYDSNSYSGVIWQTCCYSEHDNSLYLLSPEGNSSQAVCWFARIDLATGVYTRITNYLCRNKFSYHLMAHGNEIILLPGNEGFSGKIYNIDDQSFQDLTYDVKNCICTQYHSSCDFGAYHYIFNLDWMSDGGNINQVWQIHKDTLEYQDVTGEFQDADIAPVIGIFHDGERFQAYRGTDPTSNNNGYTKGVLIPMDMETSHYDTNAVIIVQSAITRSGHSAALWTYPFILGRLKQLFFDVYYYNKETGFDFTSPMYYGDGSKWIQFK